MAQVKVAKVKKEPDGTKVEDWLATLWRANIELEKTAMKAETVKESVDIATAQTKIAEIARKYISGDTPVVSEEMSEDQALAEIRKELARNPRLLTIE